MCDEFNLQHLMQSTKQIMSQVPGMSTMYIIIYINNYKYNIESFSSPPPPPLPTCSLENAKLLVSWLSFHLRQNRNVGGWVGEGWGCVVNVKC